MMRWKGGLTKRRVLTAVAGAWVNRAAWGYSKSDFWNQKAPSEWSPENVTKLLTRSPWAKEVNADFDMSGMGGLPGGGMGGPPGGGDRGGPPKFRAVVRWESAIPIREALKTAQDGEAANSYVISISGLPDLTNARARSGTAEGEPDASRQEEMFKQVKEQTILEVKNKEAMRPSRISRASDGGKLLFFFDKSSEPITLNDKEVAFTTHLGPLVLKTKFALKDMLYHGELAL